MRTIDWVVLFGTLSVIVIYGTWRTRGSKDIQSYLLGNKTLPWWSVGLSIMATQASAITFLSVPGQAYEDGMRFLQFYFGLPMAMVILCITAVPIYHRLKVYTAYEYLESRFDVKVRSLTAFYFLMSRGISVGITVFAPSLILSAILGWNITLTTVFTGAMAMIYTIAGGSRAVSLTQKYQLTVIMGGMVTAGLIAFSRLPDHVSFGDTFSIAGELGKLNLVNLKFDLQDRYNIWSGLIGGLFLFLSYFGTDQSQVGRYLGGKSVPEIRLGLLFNGLLKIPMQFVILYIGILVFVFYQFTAPPVFHNSPLKERALQTAYGPQIRQLESAYHDTFNEQKRAAESLAVAIHDQDENTVALSKSRVKQLQSSSNKLRDSVKVVIAKAVPGANTADRDYVFINFVVTYLPHGLIGLLLAVVFSAAMSSMSSELNSLASTTTVDFYKRSINPHASDRHYLRASRLFTTAWAVFGMLFAFIANQAENLIQFVNIIGSLFYGTILGVFVSAFYIKFVKSTAVFVGGIVAELIILYLYFFQRQAVAFLLYNIIGCAAVVITAILVEVFIRAKERRRPSRL